MIEEEYRSPFGYPEVTEWIEPVGEKACSPSPLGWAVCDLVGAVGLVAVLVALFIW